MNGDKLDRIEKIMEETMARQQCHDEAWERLDARPITIPHAIAEMRSAIARDVENIRVLARIAEIHERRLSDIEGSRDT